MITEEDDDNLSFGMISTYSLASVFYHLSADLVLIVHFLFIVFAVLGAGLVLRWKKVAWVHLPAVIWACVVEFCGWICPLTPLEKSLRRLGGSNPYSTDFVEHYLMPVIYPEHLTRTIQIVLGGLVLLINVLLYGYVIRRIRSRGGPRVRPKK